MTAPLEQPRKGTARDLLFFSTPRLWPTWPFLAVVRRHTDGEMDYGVLFDFAGTSGRTGYGSAVFLTNIFLLPQTEAEFLALPKEVFDTFEEMAAAGWVVD
jgi:hypothetical protein